jgi:hypothetical protein
MRLLGLLFLSCLAASGQAVLEGDVVNALSGARLGGVNVYVQVLRGERPTTQTDASGHFHLLVPQMQSYTLQTGYPGYLPNRRELQVDSPRGITNLRIELCRGAAIAGRIDDDDQFPVEGARVQLLAYRMLGGERKLDSVKYIDTDDLGRFRFANLRPGRYWLAMVSANSFWDSRYVPQYYPGVHGIEDARAIDLKPGEEFVANLVTVSGRLDPAASSLSFWPEGPNFSTTFPVIHNPDGSFTVRHVPPGKYLLSSESKDYRDPANSLTATLLLTVGREDVSGIVLQARPLPTVRLPYRLIGAEQHPELLELTVRARTLTRVPAPAGSMAEGMLSITGLLPEHYDIDVHQSFLQHGPGVNGILHPISAQLAGKEVLQTGFDLDATTSGPLVVTPLVITMSNHPIEVQGRLRDAAGRRAAGELVALISPRGVPEAAATTGADGSFGAKVWRPGEYRVALITDEEEWNDPDFLLTRAEEFPLLRIVEGENPRLDLRLKK